jgi:hypothetical protein
VHRDIRPLEHSWNPSGPRHTPIIPHPVVLHPESTGRSLIVVCKLAFGAEDLNDSTPDGRGHYD